MAAASSAAARARNARGYRNKNPGNIDYNASNKWQGQVGKEPAGRFAVFESHEYGIRALAMLLTTYQDRHGLRTIREIVNRWAPPVENQTSAYAAHVADLMGRSETARLDLHRYEDMRGLVEAIITHELGGQPYDAATIEAGLRLAGLARPVPTIAAAATTGEGKAALSVASVAAAASAAAPAFQAVAGLPQWVGVAVVIAVAAVAVAVVLTQRRSAPV
jgi:hypothetical protein